MVRRRGRGITVMEVVIVAVAITTLSVAGYGMIRTTANYAKVTAAKANLSTLRNSIKLYKHRKGVYPTSAQFGLYSYTTRGSESQMVEFLVPVDPFKGEDNRTNGTVPTGTGGWLYDQATGRIWINLLDTEYGTSGSIETLPENPSTW